MRDFGETNLMNFILLKIRLYYKKYTRYASYGVVTFLILYSIFLSAIIFINPMGDIDPLSAEERKSVIFFDLALKLFSVFLFSVIGISIFNFYKIVKIMHKYFYILLILLMFDIFIYERYFLNFSNYEYYSEELPIEFNGYRIAIISDLHYGKLTPDIWVSSVFQKVNDLKPDLIIGLGDYVLKTKSTEDLYKIWPLLLTLKANDGEFFVNGNHESWADEKSSLELLKNSGKSIRNSFKIIERGKSKIAIGGTGDLWTDEIDIDKTFKESPKNIFTIIATHNPDAADLKHARKINLYLAGHTHGGQVRVPFFNFAPILPVTNKDYDAGFKMNNVSEKLFISTGIGWSILPLRFNCRAEVPIITLKKIF